MENRRRFIPTVIAAAFVALFLPLIASAQGNDSWGRDRRDNRNNGRFDNRYENRTLRDAARRLDDKSMDFQRHLDSALDHSRIDGTRREDSINRIAAEFRSAASQLRYRVGDGRDFNRGSGEAQRLLQLGSRIDRLVSRARLDRRAESDWMQIRQDLRLIGNFFNSGGYDRRDDRRDNDNEWRRRQPF